MKNIRFALFCLVLVIVAAAGFLRFEPGNIHTDIRALLPQTAESNAAEKILAHSSEAARSVWVLVGDHSLDKAAAAAALFSDSLLKNGIAVQKPLQDFNIKAFAEKLAPWRMGYLTESDAAFLASADDAKLLRRSLSLLYRPVSPLPLAFEDDPLGTFENALLQTASGSTLRFSGPCTSLAQPIEGVHYCVLTIKTRQAMTAVSGTPVADALQKACAALEEPFPQARVHAAGIALISEEAASTASSEATFIGSVSAAGIILLVVLFFAHAAPLFITLVALAASLIFASCVVLLVFDEVHILTLVFGATLLGICVDYVFHMLCATATGLSGPQAAHKLMKPLTLSLLTTCIGYGVMALSPMPGLRQMAVFCIAGLFAAYAGVVFAASPCLKAAQPSHTARAFSKAFRRLPHLEGKSRGIFLGLCVLTAAAGCFKLQTQNELALINRIPEKLLADMQFVGKALSPVSPGQVFLIKGDNAEAVLQANEALQKRLEELVSRGLLAKAPDPTALLPSARAQQQAAALAAPAEKKALGLLEASLASGFPAPSAASFAPLDLPTFKRLAPGALSSFWLSDAELLVPLAGVTPQALPHLEEAARGIPGVRFVNTTAEVAESLAHYRDGVFYALLSALVVIGLVLAASLRRRFITYCTPTVISIALTLGICGFAGIPFSLFTVLPLVLVLGLGVDYAIILYSEPDPVAARSSVFLAASSTLLAFGLLAFSSTPALSFFGLTILIAMSCVLICTTLLRPRP